MATYTKLHNRKDPTSDPIHHNCHSHWWSHLTIIPFLKIISDRQHHRRRHHRHHRHHHHHQWSSSPLPPHHRSLQGLCDSICGRASRDKSNFFSISIHDRVFWIEIQFYHFCMFCRFEMLIFFKSASYPPGICPLTDVASFTESQIHRIRIPDP